MRNITEANLVAYLKAKGFQESTTRPKVIRNTVTFFFEESPELTQEIDAFFRHGTTIEPLAMAESLRLVKSQIVDIKRNEKLSGGGE